MTMRMMAAMLAVTMGCCMTANAQMAATPKIAPGTMIEPAKTLDAMLQGFEDEMMPLAKAMPADKYSFAPSAAIFASGQKTEFATVRTFGQQVAHIAAANYSYASRVGGLKPDVDVKAVGDITDKDKAVAALAASFAFAHKAIANLTEKNAFESVRETMTRASLAAQITAHGFDHYGQLVVYARMNGIVPPASAK